MKVKKLISELRKLPPDTEVAFVVDDCSVFISKDFELSYHYKDENGDRIITIVGK